MLELLKKNICKVNNIYRKFVFGIKYYILSIKLKKIIENFRLHLT